MSRIWKGDGWELREGRWQDSPLETCDHVISDPPFNDRTSLGARSYAGNGKTKRTVTSFMGIDPHQITESMIDAAKRWVIMFCAFEQLGAYENAAGHDQWIRSGAWVKSNPTPQFSGDRPATFGEAIAIMHRKGRKRWNRGGHTALYTGSSEHGTNCSDPRLHETQKPLWLTCRVIEDFTDPGDLVWDPYCGSGTTGVACLRLGRRFIGHEMQPHYAEVAARRLEAEQRGLTLADADRGQMSILDAVDS
jgi:site-specific DNA-methyltransferase (adenine-specific)